MEVYGGIGLTGASDARAKMDVVASVEEIRLEDYCG